MVMTYQEREGNLWTASYDFNCLDLLFELISQLLWLGSEIIWILLKL